jgi:serine/threonine protein kinase
MNTAPDITYLPQRFSNELFATSKQRIMYVLQGGKLIGKGTYGCVFDPPLKCKSKWGPLKKNVVGKITQPIDFSAEAEAAKELATLDVRSKYFVLPDIHTACEILPISKQSDKDIQKCDPIMTDPNQQMIQFEMPNAGKSLYKRLNDADIRTPEFFMKLMGFLLEAGAYLAAKSFVHYDIKEDNILIDESKSLKVIDFGQSFSAKTITKDVLDLRWKIYNPAYAAEAPECTLFGAILYGENFSKALSEICDQKAPLQHAERLLGISRKKQKLELLTFWNQSRAARERDPVQFFKLYWPGFDAFMIGGTLISVLQRLILLPNFSESSKWLAKKQKIFTILRGLLQANPRNRIDCIQALHIWDPTNVWFQTYGTTWISSREKQKPSSL